MEAYLPVLPTDFVDLVQELRFLGARGVLIWVHAAPREFLSGRLGELEAECW